MKRRILRTGHRGVFWQHVEPLLARLGEVPFDGPLSCWLSAVEEALAFAEAAKEARNRSGAARSRLVAVALETGLLGDLAPGGTIPTDFASRCARQARTMLRRLAREAPLYLAPWVKTGHHRFRIPFAADPDLGRPDHELEIPSAGVRYIREGGANPLRLRIPSGTPALADLTRALSVGAVLEVRSGSVRIGARCRPFERRVDHALVLLEEVWMEAAHTVRGFAWRVVPVTDRSMVSYSSARRPGVLYIHVGSRPSIRLAEDLLHETVHVRVHALESLHSLVVPCAPDGEPPRFWSPWRQEWRPVRGLLHGACTFTAGEEFFERSLRAGERGALRLTASRRRWLARRLLEERESVAIALRVLAVARRRGYLTPEGRRLLDTVRRTHGGLSRSAGNRRRELATTRAGRRELETFGEWKAAMAARPLRWGW